MTNISLQKKEVFWDFDGTLFDSYPLTIAAVQEVFHAHHIDVSSQEIHDRMMTTVYHALQEILAEHPSDCRIEECLAAIKKVDPADFLLYPNVKKVLELVVNSGGHNYLLTHRDHSAVEAIEHQNIESLFTEYIISESGYPRKPDPASIIDTAAQHHFSLKDAVVIGDRELEIELARNAGVPVIWYASNPVVPKIKPDAVIYDYKELLSQES